jgi:hypothetical protein
MPLTATTIDFQADWKSLWSAEEAEIELTGFKFHGPGWYLEKTGSILVLPAREPDKFWFMVYNERDGRAAFKDIVDAPVNTHI